MTCTSSFICIWICKQFILRTPKIEKIYIEEDYSSSGRLFCCKGGFKEILLSLLARRLRIDNIFTVHCQYITLRFLGDNPPASYVFLPSLLILTIAIFLLKTGWRHPADILCLHQRWNRCILSAPCSGWFVNTRWVLPRSTVWSQISRFLSILFSSPSFGSQGFYAQVPKWSSPKP